MNLFLQLSDRLSDYGAPSGISSGEDVDGVVLLPLNGPSSPQTINFLDIFQGRERFNEDLWPDAVLVHNGRPVLYVVDRSGIFSSDEPRSAEISKLRQRLANREDQAYLGILHYGRLDVYSINFTKAKKLKPALTAEQGKPDASSLIPRLALEVTDPADTGMRSINRTARYAFDRIFRLLTTSAEQLKNLPGNLSEEEVFALVGRALFVRFLVDRDILKENDVPELGTGEHFAQRAFATPEEAAATCHWLDETFNGNLLPLIPGSEGPSRCEYVSYFKGIARNHFPDVSRHLTAVLRGWDTAGNYYQSTLNLDGNNWDDFDFAHIPVGLLSRVYETFSRMWLDSSKEISIHYTPPIIVETILDQALDGVVYNRNYKVLDPACGGGVFLVAAFRRLYAMRWSQVLLEDPSAQKRPGKRDIHRILYHQLRGYDINAPAIRLSALALFLTSIELNPRPRPPKTELGFPRKLEGEVLFNWHQAVPDQTVGRPEVGSIGRHAAEGDQGKYDLVLANPPWTSLEQKDANVAHELELLTQDVFRRHGFEALSQRYQAPGQNPDLPFLFKSLDWAKPGGRIGMVLHARVILRQGRSSDAVRAAIFNSFRVPGIINCSNLADTPVWPKMNQPFFLLLAINERPNQNQRTNWLTIHADRLLNERGLFRVDFRGSYAVEPTNINCTPWLWKVMALGSSLDEEVVRKIKNKNQEAGLKSLKEYWNLNDLVHSTGYEIRPNQKEQYSVEELKDLSNLEDGGSFRFAVDPSRLSTLRDTGLNSMHRPRNRRGNHVLPIDEQVYKGPMVLLKKSPGFDRTDGFALLSKENLLFSESFYGYSAGKAKNADLLVAYLHLLAHSNLWRHYSLMTSSEFAAERRVFQKQEIDGFPFLPPEALGKKQIEEIRRLSSALLEMEWEEVKEVRQEVLEEIDEFFCALYGLDEWEIETVADAVEISLPYKSSRLRAAEWPKPSEVDAYCLRLIDLIQPFFEVVGERLTVRPLLANGNPVPRLSPYGYLLFDIDGQERSLDSLIVLTAQNLAWSNGQSLIVHRLGGALLVGIINEYRYWTKSAGRLLARDIIRYYLDEFPLPGACTESACF